jgi:hypothetical protein
MAYCTGEIYQTLIKIKKNKPVTKSLKEVPTNSNFVSIFHVSGINPQKIPSKVDCSLLLLLLFHRTVFNSLSGHGKRPLCLELKI